MILQAGSRFEAVIPPHQVAADAPSAWWYLGAYALVIVAVLLVVAWRGR